MRFSILAFLVFLFCSTVHAEAHRLNVFAWLDNDQIVVDCNFGKDKPAVNASVYVIDAVSNKEILDGQTTGKGNFSFPVPDVIRQGHNLIIKVNAGQGHSGEWTVEASELYAAASLAAGFEEAATPASTPTESLTITAQSEQLKAIIHSAMEAQLAPIRQQLAEYTSRGPGMVEILGGIGWIIGLAGIAMYFKGRKAG